MWWRRHRRVGVLAMLGHSKLWQERQSRTVRCRDQSGCRLTIRVSVGDGGLMLRIGDGDAAILPPLAVGSLRAALREVVEWYACLAAEPADLTARTHPGGAATPHRARPLTPVCPARQRVDLACDGGSEVSGRHAWLVDATTGEVDVAVRPPVFDLVREVTYRDSA